MPVREYDADMPIENLMALAGLEDANLRTIEANFPVRIYIKSQVIKLDGESEEVLDDVYDILNGLLERIDNGKHPDAEETQRLCQIVLMGKDPKDIREEPVVRCRSGKVIYPKTENQKRLIRAFKNNSIIFATGPAGTGKTYLAVAWAVNRLKRQEIEKIILTRPAVEAGESLGFLPGDMKEKVDPYLRPLYDALNEMLGQETVARYIEKEIIEIAPLAFMRGRTLSNAAVILDEAQNTTRAQMKMFLTRMGKSCQMMINGDETQTDLIKKKDSGLIQATEILQDIDGIAIEHLDASDVVRNPLVAKIIERYEEASQ